MQTQRVGADPERFVIVNHEVPPRASHHVFDVNARLVVILDHVPVSLPPRCHPASARAVIPPAAMRLVAVEARSSWIHFLHFQNATDSR